jgi:hypothetical protein
MIFCPAVRAIRSNAVPGENGTTIVMRRAG